MFKIKILFFFFQERDELLRQLRDSSDAETREEQRQLLRMRLHREKRRAEQEKEYDAALIAMGLAKQGEQV